MSNPWVRLATDRMNGYFLEISPPYVPTCDALDDCKESDSCPSLITVTGVFPEWASWEGGAITTTSYSASLGRSSLCQRSMVWTSFLNLECHPEIAPLRLPLKKKKCFPVEYDSFAPIMRQVSYVMSDLIIFNAISLVDAAGQFLSWLQACRKLIDNDKFPYYGPRPRAIVLVKGSLQNHLEFKDFYDFCLQQEEARGLDSVLLNSVFEDYKILSSPKDLEKSVDTYITIRRGNREFMSFLWSQKAFHKLHCQVAEELCRKSPGVINVVNILGPFSLVSQARTNYWSEFERQVHIFQASESCKAGLTDFVHQTMMNCFAWYIFKCPHSELCTLCTSRS